MPDTSREDRKNNQPDLLNDPLNPIKSNEPGLIGHLIQLGLTSATTSIAIQAIAAPFLQGAVPAANGIDVTHAAPDLNGAELHAGPAGGGGMLDRPVAGYMADHATSHGLELSYQHGQVSHIASNINDAGTMTVQGHTINVMEYAPGGEFVRAAAGTAGPMDGLNMMGHALIAAHRQDPGIELGRHLTDSNSLVGSASRGTSSPDDYRRRREPLSNILDPGMVTGGDYDYVNNAKNTKTAGNHRSLSMFDPHWQGDGIDNEPELDAGSPALSQLETEHRFALQTAFETSEMATVDTEIHVGHKTLAIHTSFEARGVDHQLEQQEGETHLRAAMAQPGKATDNSWEHFRIRSMIEEQDSGRSISR